MKRGDKVVFHRNPNIGRAYRPFYFDEDVQIFTIHNIHNDGFSRYLILNDKNGRELPDWVKASVAMPYDIKKMDSIKEVLKNAKAFSVGDIVFVGENKNYYAAFGEDNSSSGLYFPIINTKYESDGKIIKVTYHPTEGYPVGYDVEFSSGTEVSDINPLLIISYTDRMRMLDNRFMQKYQLVGNLNADDYILAGNGDIFVMEGDYLTSEDGALSLESSKYLNLFTKLDS